MLSICFISIMVNCLSSIRSGTDISIRNKYPAKHFKYFLETDFYVDENYFNLKSYSIIEPDNDTKQRIDFLEITINKNKFIFEDAQANISEAISLGFKNSKDEFKILKLKDGSVLNFNKEPFCVNLGINKNVKVYNVSKIYKENGVLVCNFKSGEIIYIKNCDYYKYEGNDIYIVNLKISSYENESYLGGFDKIN